MNPAGLEAIRATMRELQQRLDGLGVAERMLLELARNGDPGPTAPVVPAPAERPPREPKTRRIRHAPPGQGAEPRLRAALIAYLRRVGGTSSLAAFRSSREATEAIRGSNVTSDKSTSAIVSILLRKDAGRTFEVLREGRVGSRVTVRLRARPDPPPPPSPPRPARSPRAPVTPPPRRSRRGAPVAHRFVRPSLEHVERALRAFVESAGGGTPEEFVAWCQKSRAFPHIDTAPDEELNNLGVAAFNVVHDWPETYRIDRSRLPEAHIVFAVKKQV